MEMRVWKAGPWTGSPATNEGAVHCCAEANLSLTMATHSPSEQSNTIFGQLRGPLYSCPRRIFILPNCVLYLTDSICLFVSGFSSRADETPSPPPLPPKSPRTTTKPIRPHDFPQRLKSQGEGSPELPLIQPPPPPRRNSDQHVQDVHAKLRRLVRDRPSLKGRIQAHNQAITIPVTLPSPILPSTPPADVIMESPMSDSGPIISPPPAFSTPVTPMIDRQNSSASEKSNLSKIQLFPTSGSMSVVSAGSSSKSHKSVIGRGRNGNASISDISMRHSSKSPSGSESTSSPCPMSGGSPVAEETNGSADDDSSRKSPLLPPRPPIAKKYPSIPKSVTENTLYRVGSFESGTREQRNPTPIGIGTQTRHHSISSQTEGNPMGKLGKSVWRGIEIQITVVVAEWNGI